MFLYEVKKQKLINLEYFKSVELKILTKWGTSDQTHPCIVLETGTGVDYSVPVESVKYGHDIIKKIHDAYQSGISSIEVE